MYLQGLTIILTTNKCFKVFVNVMDLQLLTDKENTR